MPSLPRFQAIPCCWSVLVLLLSLTTLPRVLTLIPTPAYHSASPPSRPLSDVVVSVDQRIVKNDLVYTIQVDGAPWSTSQSDPAIESCALLSANTDRCHPSLCWC